MDNIYTTYIQFKAPSRDNVDYSEFLEPLEFSPIEFTHTEDAPTESTLTPTLQTVSQIVPQTEPSDYKEFIELLKEEGIPFIVTSSYRHNSKTSKGRASNHSKKDDHGNSMAYDIQPYFNGKVDKSDDGFNKLRQAIYSNKRIVGYLRKRGWGIYEEITPEVLKKTGGTGKHFHVGPDSVAKADTIKRLGYDLYAKKGGVLKKWKIYS